MGSNVRLEGGPLHGKEVPVEEGQDELRVVLSSDADAGLSPATREHLYRRIDASTFAFDRSGTISDRIPSKPPSKLTTTLLSLGSRLAPRLRIASAGQLLLLLLIPVLFTTSLEGLPRYLPLIADGLLMGLLGLPAFSLFELKGRGLRVTRWDQALGILSLTAGLLGFLAAGVALYGS